MRWWKARNFREQVQLQEQLWCCATLTTSLRCSLDPPRFKDRCRSVARTGASGRRLKYERALVIVCPILLLFAHHCGISAERSATCCFQRGYLSQQEREEKPRASAGPFC